MTSSTFP